MRNKKKKSKKKRAEVIILSTAVTLAAGFGLCFVLLYALGGARLRASAESNAPDAILLSGGEAQSSVIEKMGLSTVKWEDDWVGIDGKVYSYDDRRINLLVLGIDKAGKMEKAADYEKWEAGQADAVFLLSINPTKEDISIIGIPRNTMVNVDIYDREDHVSEERFDQICLQYPYAGGGKSGFEKTKKTVSEMLYGLPIHGGFAVGYDAVSKINDKLGGVDVIALESLSTPYYGSYKKGENLHLEGKLVLAYVKSRNMEILGSPTMRLERQKQYLTALIGKAKSEVKKNPGMIGELYKIATDYMYTDVTLDKAVYLAAQAVGYHFDGSAIHLLKGEDRAVQIEKDGVKTEDYYNEYYLDEKSLKDTMIEVFYTEVVLEN